MNLTADPVLDTDAIFRRLRALDESLLDANADKHDRAHLLINACLTEGLSVGKLITGMLERLGLNRRHAGICLADGVQREPVWPNWGRREDGTYYAPLAPASDT